MTVRQMLMERGRPALLAVATAARSAAGINADVLGPDRLAAANGTENPERVRSALRYIPVPPGRAQWMALVWAVCAALGQAGRQISLEWSKTDAATFEQAAFDNVWDSYHEREGGITAATLFGLARANGWKDARRDPEVGSESQTPDATPTDLALAHAFARVRISAHRGRHFRLIVDGISA